MPEPRGCVVRKYDDECPVNWETDPDFMQEWWAESGLGLEAFNARYNSVREAADSDEDDDDDEDVVAVPLVHDGDKNKTKVV